MSDHQKDAFAERLKRIDRNPGNGRMVEPGAAEAAPDKKSKKRRGKKAPVAKRKVFKKPRGGLGWLYGFLTGAGLLWAWIALYPAMSTPRSWGLGALPVPPAVMGIAIGGTILLGLGLLQRFSPRMIFIMFFGMLTGWIAIAAVAALIPSLGVPLTNETFSGQLQGLVSGFLEE